MVYQQMAEMLDNVVGSTKLTFNFLSSGNFLISLILNSSMQQLWGMVRSMQMITNAAILEVNTPAHAQYFFVGCMNFAKIDILDGSSFYQLIFDFLPTEPLNLNYEILGLSTKNFILNSASYFIYIFAIAFGVFIKYLIN